MEGSTEKDTWWVDGGKGNKTCWWKESRGRKLGGWVVNKTFLVEGKRKGREGGKRKGTE